MNNINIEDYNNLKQNYEELLIKYNKIEEKLKSYTNTNSHKKYYENNSEVVKQKAKEYMEKVKENNPEKLKEWRRNAYIKRKAKLQTQTSNSTD